jgi:alpha-tubulin suppressor-like RCC1 family protein
MIAVDVPELSNVIGIAASARHTCARRTDGTVACWGGNEYGELGNGTTEPSTVPVAVIGLSSATEISVGSYHTCAVLADGTAACWGDGESGQLGHQGIALATRPVSVVWTIE